MIAAFTRPTTSRFLRLPGTLTLLLLLLGASPSRAEETLGPVEPPPRQGATSFTIGGKVYLVGGKDPSAPLERQAFLEDAWRYSGGSWLELPDLVGDDGPPQMEGATATTTAEGDALIFPGFDSNGDPGSDVLYFLEASGAFFFLGTPHPDGFGGASLADAPDFSFLAGGSNVQRLVPANTGRVFDKRSATMGFGPLIQLSNAVRGATGFFSPLHQLFGFLFGSDLSPAPTRQAQGIRNATGPSGSQIVDVANLPQSAGIPVARTDQASAQQGEQIAVFGGKDTQGNTLGDLWLINANDLAAQVIGDNITKSSFTYLGTLRGRKKATLTFIDANHILVFGGEDENGNTLQSSEVIALEEPMFADGFESGNTSAWN